jgi:hypothetical protein
MVIKIRILPRLLKHHGRRFPRAYGPRETSVKYADHAPGEFLDRARRSSCWKNTVFPVITGDSIAPPKIPGITSQIDVLPSLLSLIGLNAEHSGIGRDLTRPERAQGSGRAQIQFHANQAFAEDGRMGVLQPDREAMTFRLDAAGKMDTDPDADPAPVRRARADALWGG